MSANFFHTVTEYTDMFKPLIAGKKETGYQQGFMGAVSELQSFSAFSFCFLQLV